MSDERTLEQRVAAIHRYGDPVTERIALLLVTFDL